MNREIKFRAWDNVNKRMGYFAPGFQWLDEYDVWHLTEADGNPNSSITDVPFGDNINLMQYTGLKDKNGKEIYEGDIIRSLKSDKPFSQNKKFCNVLMVVNWDSGNTVSENDFNNKALAADPSCFNRRPGFYGKEIFNEKGYGCGDWSEFSGCEVIGNVYENPELIKENVSAQ